MRSNNYCATILQYHPTNDDAFSASNKTPSNLELDQQQPCNHNNKCTFCPGVYTNLTIIMIIKTVHCNM